MTALSSFDERETVTELNEQCKVSFNNNNNNSCILLIGITTESSLNKGHWIITPYG